jgi:REP element-mobilizing transposase RayT
MKQLPHGRDLRKGRVSLDSHAYMVTSVTYDRRPFFLDFDVGRILVSEIQRTDLLCHSDTLAFVVMPDHLHWLFTLNGDISLSALVGGIKRHSARQINDYLQSAGQPVWQRGFHDHTLRHEEDVQHVARYIIANPLRAGLVKRIGDYPLWDAVWL